MINLLISLLDSDDEGYRQDSALGLGEIGERAVKAIEPLRMRLLSTSVTLHDRTCAAWSLARLVTDEKNAVISELLHVLKTETATPDADRLRHQCAESIQELRADEETMQIVNEICRNDPYWGCRMFAGIDVLPEFGLVEGEELDLSDGYEDFILESDFGDYENK